MSDFSVKLLPMDLVGLSEIAEMLLTRKQQAWRWSQREDFPAPIVVLRQGPVWTRKDIEQWAEDRGYIGVLSARG